MAGVEQTIHLKSLSSSERALGADVRMEFGNILKRVGKGHGHLVGFSIVAVASSTAALTSDAITGADFLTLLGELRLTVAGVELFGAGLNGRDLRDDMILRERAVSQGDPSDEASNQNATVASTVQLTYRFGSRAKGMRRDGLVDLALLDHRVEPDSALRFKLGSSLVGSPTGWTLNSFTSVDLYATIRYEPEPVRAPLHVVEVQNFSELSGTITPVVPGAVTRLDYAVIRPTPEETGGQDVSGWTGIAIRHESRAFATKDATELGAAATIDGLRPNQAVTGHMPSDIAPGTGRPLEVRFGVLQNHEVRLRYQGGRAGCAPKSPGRGDRQ